MIEIKLFVAEETLDSVYQYQFSGRAVEKQHFRRFEIVPHSISSWIYHTLLPRFLISIRPFRKKPLSESIIKPSFGKSFLSFQFIFRQSVYFSPQQLYSFFHVERNHDGE